MADTLKRDDWEDIIVPALTGGLRVNTRADVLDNSQSPALKNVFFHEDSVRVDRGYSTFLGVVRGAPRKAFQFVQQDGTSWLVLLTNDTFYVENNDEWQYVSDGTDTTLSGNEAGGQTILSVVSETGFSASDYVGITLDDDTQHQTTVASTGVGTITVDDALPSAAASGKAVVKAVDLNGVATTPVDLVVMPAYDWLILTNGVDNIQRFDGSTIEDLANLPESGNTQCRALVVFNNHLLLLNTTEGGTAYPQRVRRSDTGDPTDWTNGNAGYEDLFDRSDHLVAGNLLGPYVVIYRDRSISRGEYVGSADLLFKFTTVVTQHGAVSPASVVDLGESHLVMSENMFYEYRGDFDVGEGIDEPIHSRIFGADGNLNSGKRNASFGIYVEELREVWFAYPRGDNDAPNTILRYRTDERTWSYRDLQHDMLGFGLFRADTSLTWSEAPGVWLDYDYSWNSLQVLVSSPTILLCGESPLQVYEYDYISVDDAGLDIDFEFETKDFIQAGFWLRIDWIEFYMVGGETTVDYSTDSGENWTTYGTIDASPCLCATRLYGDEGQVTAEQIRWRISGTGQGFRLGWFKMRLKLESQW